MAITFNRHYILIIKIDNHMSAPTWEQCDIKGVLTSDGVALDCVPLLDAIVQLSCQSKFLSCFKDIFVIKISNSCLIH